jgi:hypothetical protein
MIEVQFMDNRISLLRFDCNSQSRPRGGIFLFANIVFAIDTRYRISDNSSIGSAVHHPEFPDPAVCLFPDRTQGQNTVLLPCCWNRYPQAASRAPKRAVPPTEERCAVHKRRRGGFRVATGGRLVDRVVYGPLTHGREKQQAPLARPDQGARQ